MRDGIAPSFIGLSEQAAEALAAKHDLPLRVARPGVGLTEDACASRVTVWLVLGAIVATRLG